MAECKGAVRWYNSPSDFSITFSHPIRFRLKSYRVTNWVLSRKQSLKLIENLKCVQFSIDSLVRIVMSQWLFPIQQKYSIGFINQKLIVKSYRVTISTIDSNRLTWSMRLKIWWKIASCDRTLRQLALHNTTASSIMDTCTQVTSFHGPIKRQVPFRK